MHRPPAPPPTDFMKMADPDFDAAANPMTVAQAQGFAHFTAAFGHYQGCLREKAQWRNLMARTLELAQQHPAVCQDQAAAIGERFETNQASAIFCRASCLTLRSVDTRRVLLWRPIDP